MVSSETITMTDTASTVQPITHVPMASTKPKNGGVTQFWRKFRKKKAASVSGSSKGNKSYVIPTGSKAKSVDNHGYSNSSFDWNTMNSQSSEDLIHLPTDPKLHAKLILKSATEPCKHDEDEKRDKKQVCRTMTQPSGTITYTVKENETLNGIAARFDATPSELVKLNRLSSRFIFPDQVLFVPSKNLGSSDNSSDVGSCGDGTDVQEQQNVSQKSPKPGHVERIQSPPLSPKSHILTEEEERNLDKECIERFLKINVRHITDGQGVVAGVLLVTPNAVMFDPNVSDQLVIEHGAEKYGVIAPMDYVVNAAMYNDIATMYVSHAPPCDSRPIHSPPQVYHASECRLSWPLNNLDTITSARQKRTDSIQAINGSMSDIGITPDEDSLRESQPVKQIRHMSTSDSTSNLDSEVFVEEEAATTSQIINSQIEPEASNAKIQEDETEQTVSASEINQNIPNEVEGKTEVPEFGEEALNTSDGEEKQQGNELPSNNDPLQQQPTVTAAATQSEQSKVLKESLRRKNSNVFENKMKALKQLSYPLTWMESIGGSEKDKENSPPLSSLPETATTATSTSATTQQPAQSTLSKILSSASPKTLVDFSSGFFTKTADESGSHEEIGPTSKKSNIRPASLHESTVTGNSVFYDENERQSGKKEGAIIERRPHSMGESRERKVGFKSGVSVDDMPDLFASIDQLIPRPAKACDDPPLYLCLRMGKPLNKPVQKSTPIMAYGKKRMKREYWFSIPRDRVDDLYSFFNHWAPNVYGDLDEDAIRKFGYELITSEEEFSDDEQKQRRDSGEGSGQSNAEDDNFNVQRSEWEIMRAPHLKFFSRLRNQVRGCTFDTEVVSASELKKQMSLEAELPLPDLIGDTAILEEEHRKTLVKHLPARAVGYAWSLIFSSAQHGFSLSSLYRKMQNFDTPVLLIIKDDSNNVFGAMTSCSLKISEHFYGTGESFLFTFYPEFRIFKWTGDNEYFIKGNTESLVIGAGDGVFGLWLDGDLYNGRSHECSTYNNTTLSPEEDFHVANLEAWGFVEVDTSNP